MKSVNDTVSFRVIFISTLTLLLVTVTGFLVAIDVQKSCRAVLVANNSIGRIQTEATLHLINYVQSGYIRDLQRFRNTISPLADLAHVPVNPVEGEVPGWNVEEILLRIGLSEKEASRVNGWHRLSGLNPVPVHFLSSWEDAVYYHNRMFELSRRTLRYHVNGYMTPQRTREIVGDLQILNLEIMDHQKRVEDGLASMEDRAGRLAAWLLGVLMFFGILFIGYSGYRIEQYWKWRERILTKSRSRYQEMFEQSGIGIVQVGLDGRLLWANSAMARILGYNSVDDLFAGRSNFERLFLDSERKKDFKTAMHDHGFVTNFMYRGLRKDDKEIWLLCNAGVMKDDQGKIRGYEASYQDYTLYRQTNQELHQLTSVLRGTTQSVYQLLLTREFDDAVNESLKIIGRACAADRVYVYRNIGDNGDVTGKMVYEWVKYKSLSVINNSVTGNVKLQKIDKGSVGTFKKGEIVQLVTARQKGALESFLKKQKIRVAMLAPVQVGDRLWGWLGFDNCSNDDQWKGDIPQVIRTLASALGHYIRNAEIETSLRESEDQYRTLAGHVKEIIFRTDEEGVISYLNPAWETVTNYPVDECVGRSLSEFVHKEDEHSLREAIRKMAKKKDGFAGKEYRLITKKGYVRWLEWTCKAMEATHDGSRQIYGTIYDLTERKKSEIIMMQNNQRLEALIESSPMIITVTDPRGNLTLWNRTAEQAYGWHRSEVMGKPAPEVPENQQKEHSELLERVMSGEQLSGVELVRQRKNGSTIHISLTAAPLFDSNGRVEQVITFSQDISEAKLSKEAVRRSLKEKNVLLSEIHHRVKNNMAVISGLLSLEAREQSDPSVAEVLLESENRIRSMAMIHEKLYQNDTFAEIEFGSYLKDLALHISSQYTENGSPDINITVNPEEIYLEMMQAVPCGLLVNELFTNGCKNVVRNTPNGRIKLEVSLQGDFCYLHYRDYGSGISDKVLTDKNDSSLGYNLIQGLSRQLKGEFEIENNNGTDFRLWFRVL